MRGSEPAPRVVDVVDFVDFVDALPKPGSARIPLRQLQEQDAARDAAQGETIV
ncbi:hypothetical protein [Burkholderia sp. Bp8963]|uniref:hypothetical protein n=1 Tax=Burkholderia sp. Bp8963 TaxID=2184547 RepID=UPI00163AEE44|nr:hypothetical protein [Burkholderia sp. Bp8963]